MLTSHHLETHRSPDLLNSQWPSWPAVARTPISYVREAEPIDALDDEVLSRRFRCWRGRSGQRYIFSVFDAAKCPAYGDAVLIAAVVESDGTRRPLAVEDTGSFPEPLLSRLVGEGALRHRPLEFHVHLLARSAAERSEMVADLRGAV